MSHFLKGAGNVMQADVLRGLAYPCRCTYWMERHLPDWRSLGSSTLSMLWMSACCWPTTRCTCCHMTV